MGKGVLVVGGGVSGLTSALCLARQGLKVTLIADRFAPQVTSVVAGALWEFPPAICGHHRDEVSLRRSRDWSLTSYRIFSELAVGRTTGVTLPTAAFYFRELLADNPQQRVKVRELSENVRGFVHDPGLIATNGVNPGLRLRDAYAHVAPVIDTDIYLDWLLRELHQAGVAVVTRKIIGSLREQESTLRNEFHAHALVNCSGLGARELAQDTVRPLRGALLRIRDAEKRVTMAHCLSPDGTNGDDSFIFIVPRGRDTVVLGGFAQPDEWGLDIGLANYNPIQQIYSRCLEFLPALKGIPIDAAEPVRVGLRPWRVAGVRLEREPGMPLVHNYGHGGSGVTLSWGCALEVAALVAEILRGG